MRGESTVVHMKLNGAQLPVGDIEGLLPALGVTLPAGLSLQGGTMTANLGLDGPVDRLVTAGNVNLSNARLAGFSIASKLAALPTLSGVKPESDTVIEMLSSNLHIAPEGIRAENLNLVIPALGSMVGGGTISPSNALNFRMVAKLANHAGMMGQLTSRIPIFGKAGKAGTIPFMIQGTTSQPIFVPDVTGAVTGGLGNSLQGQQPGSQNLGDILGGVLGKKK